MPTFFVETRFWNDFHDLSASEQAKFLKARDEFVRILREWEDARRPGVPQFPKHLGIKPMANQRQMMEFAWAPNGRCTWRYGASQKPGRFHIIWRRIGSHDIYKDP